MHFRTCFNRITKGPASNFTRSQSCLSRSAMRSANSSVRSSSFPSSGRVMQEIMALSSSSIGFKIALNSARSLSSDSCLRETRESWTESAFSLTFSRHARRSWVIFSILIFRCVAHAATMAATIAASTVEVRIVPIETLFLTFRLTGWAPLAASPSGAKRHGVEREVRCHYLVPRIGHGWQPSPASG